METATKLASELKALFADAGARGFVHARALDGDGECGLDADELVVTASTFKIAVLLEVARRAADGAFALDDRIRVTGAERCFGSTGLSVCRDDVELSIRDLALGMMNVSDNTATDVLMRLVSHDRVADTLRSLGLGRTVLVGDCAAIFRTMTEDLGLSLEEVVAARGAISADRLEACRANDPARTSRTTPREMTELLASIWQDRAGRADACEEVRGIMALQVWPHRLRAGFPGSVRTAAKTGTILSWRNEAGVVTYPDGARFAVAVFTRADTMEDVQPRVDASIGQAARIAVEHLGSGPHDRPAHTYRA